MARKLTTGVLIVAGLWLIATGTQRWLDRRAARQVAEAFLEAVTRGDRRAAQALMVPEARLSTDRRQPAADRPSPVPGEIAYRIRSLDLDGNRAAAEVSVEKAELHLRLTLELRRSPAHQWKVVRVGAPRVKRPIPPQRSAEQIEQQRRAGERLARELREALQDRPGVSVERVPLDNPPE